MNCLRNAIKFNLVHSPVNSIRIVSPSSSLFYHHHAQSRSKLTPNQVATALRPFYFEVHPDRFWNEPSAKQLNESSLKQLSQHLESLTSSRSRQDVPQAKNFAFYIRSSKNNETILKLIEIKLTPQESLRSTIKIILSSCKLSTDYINQFGGKENEQSSERTHVKVDGFWKKPNYRMNFGDFDDREEINYEEQLRQKPKETLINYLKNNIDLSREKERQIRPVRDEIIRLQKELIDNLELNNLIFDSSWSINNFRACLASLKTINQQHSGDLKLLKNRTLIFGNKTGLTIDGNVILNIEDVRQNWLKSIKTVDEYDYLIEEIPKLERKLSLLLNNIKISKRKFQQSKLIQDYREQLVKLIKSMAKYDNYDEDIIKLSKVNCKSLELVIECDAGPLMVSPTGQFIAPSSCPATILINFIISNEPDARKLIKLYNDTKNVEVNYVNRCLVELNLGGIDKDDNLTPDLMINCLISLLDNKERLRTYLRDSRLIISKYYGVQETGEICIPFNWDL